MVVVEWVIAGDVVVVAVVGASWGMCRIIPGQILRGRFIRVGEKFFYNGFERRSMCRVRKTFVNSCLSIHRPRPFDVRSDLPSQKINRFRLNNYPKPSTHIQSRRKAPASTTNNNNNQPLPAPPSHQHTHAQKNGSLLPLPPFPPKPSIIKIRPRIPPPLPRRRLPSPEPPIPRALLRRPRQILRVLGTAWCD